MLCERWDSRRGSVRRPSPYSAQREESTRWRQGFAVTTGYHGVIIILSGYLPAEREALPEESEPSQDHTAAWQLGLLLRLRSNYFFERELRRSVRMPAASSVSGLTGDHSYRMLKTTIQQGRSNRSLIPLLRVAGMIPTARNIPLTKPSVRQDALYPKRGPSSSFYVSLGIGQGCPILRASIEYIFIARSASKKSTWPLLPYPS